MSVEYIRIRDRHSNWITFLEFWVVINNNWYVVVVLSYFSFVYDMGVWCHMHYPCQRAFQKNCFHLFMHNKNILFIFMLWIFISASRIKIALMCCHWVKPTAVSYIKVGMTMPISIHSSIEFSKTEILFNLN